MWFPTQHDDIIKGKHFPHYWPFVRGIHRSPMNSPHKGQWRGALMFSWICAWISHWVNNCEAGDLRCHRAQYDIWAMIGQWCKNTESVSKWCCHPRAILTEGNPSALVQIMACCLLQTKPLSKPTFSPKIIIQMLKPKGTTQHNSLKVQLTWIICSEILLLSLLDISSSSLH